MEKKLTLKLVWTSITRTTKAIAKSLYKLVKDILLLLFSAVFIVLLAIYTFFEMVILWVDKKVSSFAERINPKWFIYIIFALIVLFVLFFSFTKARTSENCSFKADSLEVASVVRPSMEFNLDVLAQALIYVESRGNDNAKSEISSASGPLQELIIFVDEANRLSELYKLDVKFEYSDRFDRQKAIDMFKLIQHHHNPENSFIRAVTIHRGFFSEDYYSAVGDQYDALMHNLGYEGTYTDLK
jgi:hypothetical protein